LYFSDDKDELGFAFLPDFFDEWGVDWSVSFAATFESASGIAARLDRFELATFRMIFDRHMVNLVKCSFDEEYHNSSDERSLYLIYKKIPPVRVCSAISKVKSMTFEYVLDLGGKEMSKRHFTILNALSTLFYIELNHIMRAYIYFERAQAGNDSRFAVYMTGDDQLPADYELPVTNSQMAFPKKVEFGDIELF